MRTVLLFCISTLFLGMSEAQVTYNGKLGYGVSPEGHPYDFSHFDVFLQEVANTCDGGVVYANHAWRDSYASSGNIPVQQMIISTQQPVPYGYTDMLDFGWRSGDSLYLNVPGDNTNNWTNTTLRSLFLHMLINAADTLKPTYLFIGNETSYYCQLDSADYLNWVSFYHQAYDSIKAHVPNTKVGTIFNYEHLSGQGELTGFNTPYWQAFEAFDTSKIDILGLTVYPFFHDTLANDVLSTYLDPIFSRIGNKPLVITETGWPADSFIGSWESTPLQQENYVDKLFSMIDGHNVEVVNWLFLNYMNDTTNTDGDKIFRSVALRDSLGNDRPAFAKWLNYCSLSDIATRSNVSAIKVYPNPANDQLTITNNQLRITNLKILDITGKQVKSIEFKGQSKNYTVNIENLPAGLYILKVTDDKGTEVTKFVKE